MGCRTAFILDDFSRVRVCDLLAPFPSIKKRAYDLGNALDVVLGCTGTGRCFFDQGGNGTSLWGKGNNRTSNAQVFVDLSWYDLSAFFCIIHNQE